MARRFRSLDIHGITKINFEELHPLPEKPEEASTPYQAVSIPYNDGIDTHLQLSPDYSESSSVTDRSSLFTDRFSNGLFSESISSSIGTGITEGSSVYSWGIDDEFDEQAATHVRSMFEEVDRCLFENEIYSGAELQDECGNWREEYPHLRILGQQLISSEETGTELITTSSLQPVAPDIDDYDASKMPNDDLQLNINGQKVEAVVAPNNKNNDKTDDIPPLSFLQEEIFAIDGDIEEYIAYDNNNNIEYRDSIKDRKGTGKKVSSLPPMTPHAFVHETALSECFDHVWNEIIVIVNNLLLLYTQARAKKEFEHVQESFDRQMDHFLESSLELPQSRDSYGRLQPLSSQLKMKSGIFDNGGSNTNALQELMTIRSVALQQRAPSVTPNALTNDDIPLKDNLNGRPMSSVHRQFPKTTNFRYAEQQFYERMLSAKTPKRTIRLQPLPPKTAGQIESVNVGEVRGTRLQTSGGITNINNIWGGRNMTLPPLERLGTADTTISVRDIQFHRTSKRNSRASSAVSNDSKALPTRERASFQPLPDSRPYTTHSSSRTDLPFHTKSFQGSRFRDIPNTASSKGFPHPSLLSDHMYQFPAAQFKNLAITSVGEESEVDDFVLFGHGPPLLPPQQRKGKLTGSSIR